MFGALQGQHGAFSPSSLRKGDAGAYVKKSSLSLTSSRPVRRLGGCSRKPGSGQTVDSVNIPARELGTRPCTRATAVAEPLKLLGPHAPVLVSKTSDCYACAPDNLT
jgi:hypothetical protein